GTAPALARAPGVDEAWIDGAHVVPRDAQTLPGVVEKAGEEDVGAGDEAVEQGATLRLPEVDADAALVAPEMLDEEVAPRGARNQSRRDEPADRVAEAGVLDLHDLRAPVAEDRGSRRDEAPVGYLDHPHPGEDVGHGGLSSDDRAWPRSRPR